jgi:hypothetical protein
VEHRPRAARTVAEDDHGIVLDLYRPVLRAQERRHERKRSEDPVAEVEKVHSLVDQLAASCDRSACAPFMLVADSSPVPVPGAHVEYGAEPVRPRLCDRPGDSGMKAMVEPDLDSAVRRFRRPRDPADVGTSDACRLLDEDVCRRAQRRASEIGELVVRDCDDHGIELVGEQLVAGSTCRPTEPLGQRFRSSGVDVEAGDEPVPAERGCTFVADQPAADDADAERGLLRLRDGHVYSVPKQPWNSKSNRSSGALAAAMANRVSSGRRA